MSLLRLATFMACFAVIHDGTKPGHQLATLAAVLVICALIAANVSGVRR